jgi:pimeloyl-ACP methyl ester carboxylesterase
MPKFQSNGLNLNYQVAGEAVETLICLHGISSNSASWRGQLTGLSDSYRLVAWDMRGYGQSDDPTAEYSFTDVAQDVASLLDHLQLKQAIIMGLSLGGVVAQEFYRNYPDRVKSLILADTNTGGGARPEQERKSRLESRLKAIESLTPAEMAKNRAPAMLSENPSPEILQAVEQMIGEIHPFGYRCAAIALDAADTRAVLPTVKVPTLVIWGESDKIVPIEETKALAENIPGAQFVTIPNAGHLANFEQSALFNQAVRNFLTQVPSPSTGELVTG